MLKKTIVRGVVLIAACFGVTMGLAAPASAADQTVWTVGGGGYAKFLDNGDDILICDRQRDGNGIRVDLVGIGWNRTYYHSGGVNTCGYRYPPAHLPSGPGNFWYIEACEANGVGAIHHSTCRTIKVYE